MQEDANKVIINQSALAYYDLKDAQSTVGKKLRSGKQDVTIKAVISDFNQKSLKELPKPMMFMNQAVNTYFSVSTDSQGGTKLISGLGKIWEEHFPGNPFNYFFMSDFYDQQYSNDKKFSALFLASSFLAIIIACLGLSGLSAYSISRRTKEIGIRKSNGARNIQVIYLLNRDFLKWVIVSIIIAVPVAWWAMGSWLENFPYRTEIKLWIFVLSAIIATGVAILTVSWQSWKAAKGNPVEALRYE
jgi:putative ABC transport system permease protein